MKTNKFFGTDASNEISPKCAIEQLPYIKNYNEERFIRAYCPDGMKFSEFVLKIRNGNNSIKTYEIP